MSRSAIINLSSCYIAGLYSAHSAETVLAVKATVIKIHIHWLFRAPIAITLTIYMHSFSSLLHPHLAVAILNFSEKLSRFVLVQ